MKEIAIISGKGGTGKTSLTLSMIPYFNDTVVADCDVDAPDLKIILNKNIDQESDFIGFKRPVINEDLCVKCGLCYNHCKFHAITEDIEIKTSACEGCKVCEFVCPTDAITMEDFSIGAVYERTTNFGKMIDAKLIPGEESSGKLVSEVRRRAQALAEKMNAEYILIDGSPGIACNVISTITGVQLAIVVTEPTVSGLHDLKKVLSLTNNFSIPTQVVINKFDISLNKTNEIEDYCKELGIDVTMKIPFDKKMVESISNLEIPSLSDLPFFKSNEWVHFIEGMKE